MRSSPWLDDSKAANGCTVQENFSRWFDGSQAVHSNCEPRVMCHGTRHDIDQFRPIDAHCEVVGHFFTKDPDHDAYIAGDDEDTLRGQVILPVSIRLCQPLDVTQGVTDQDIKRLRAHRADLHPDSDQWMIFQACEGGLNFVHATRSADFDGVIFDENENSIACAVFSPTQVKSAIGKSGLFSNASPSLTDGLNSIAMALAHRARGVAGEMLVRCRSGVTL